MHKHILVTANVESPTKDPQVIEKWLSDLVEKVNMEVFLPPVAKYCDDPNNAGVTGVVVITTSHASIHLWDHGLLQMDLYSCKQFDEMEVIKHVEEAFKVTWGAFQLSNRDPNGLEVKEWSNFKTVSCG